MIHRDRKTPIWCGRCEKKYMFTTGITVLSWIKMPRSLHAMGIECIATFMIFIFVYFVVDELVIPKN